MSKNVPGEIQDVNYHGLGENNNYDFDLIETNENYLKDRLGKYLNDRLHFHQTYGTVGNPAGNLTAVEGQGACIP